MARICVSNEQETSRGWAFDVRIETGAGAAPASGSPRGGGSTGAGSTGTDHKVRLSWVDYEHWSHGSSTPARVIEALFEFLCARQPAMEIAPSFDAAAVRRRYPEVARVLPGEL